MLALYVVCHYSILALRRDIIHGHSSHHPKGIQVYHGKLIIYGCGDFLNDYEGISGYEAFRDDLTLMYFLNRAIGIDVQWLKDVLDRESKKWGARIVIKGGHALVLRLTD